jgi:hypothetical protein
MGCPPLLVEACKAYLNWSRDILPLIIPLVWMFWREFGSETRIKLHAPIATLLEDGFPDYAFDPLHTRPGKRAVDRWVQNLRPNWIASQVSPALWNYESAACERTLAWDEGERLRQTAYRVDLLKAGVHANECDALTSWVHEQYPALTAIRRQVWYQIYRRPYSTDTGLERANPPLPVSGERNDD